MCLDQFSINSASSKAGIALDESGISWQSDRDHKFVQPSGFKSQVNPSATNCDTLLGKSGSHNYTDASGYNYCYWYPNDATTQYLHESYPGQISPLKGVTDEHFIVWMRTASMPTFRKLYGTIKGNFKSGDVITFNVTANYEVQSVSASKALVLTTVGEFGSKNSSLGVIYVVVGVFSLLFGVLFAVKELISPRPLGFKLPDGWE